jgi:N-acetylglucosamine-6-sulfatase
VRNLPSIAIAVLLLLILSATTAAQSPEPSADPSAEPTLQPDIFVVMVDDFGYLDDERVLERLPNIRELWLKNGLRFRQMYDESPLCCPSRVSFLTGQHTLNHGVVRNNGNLLDHDDTIAVALQEAGYRTMQTGRYLIRYDGSTKPPGWDRSFIMATAEPPAFWRNGRRLDFDRGFVDDIIRRQAIKWVQNAPTDRPLFAWVTPVAPHPCQSDGEQCYLPAVMQRDQGAAECKGIDKFKPPTFSTRVNAREVRGMPNWGSGWRLRSICESMLVVDRTVGQLIEQQAKRDRPAYFIFTSDNGMAWGQKGFSLKHTPPSTRTAFYMSGPGIEPAITEALTSKIDIAPTIAELAGAAVPWADGISFEPLLRGEPWPGREELLHDMPRSNDKSYPGWVALRTPQWRYIRWENGDEELYDLAVDPWEVTNLVDKRPGVADDMEQRLDELMATAATS